MTAWDMLDAEATPMKTLEIPLSILDEYITSRTLLDQLIRVMADSRVIETKSGKTRYIAVSEHLLETVFPDIYGEVLKQRKEKDQ